MGPLHEDEEEYDPISWEEIRSHLTWWNLAQLIWLGSFGFLLGSYGIKFVWSFLQYVVPRWH